MGFLARAKAFFTKQPSPVTSTSELQIGSPNNNGLTNDANGPIPVKTGLIHTDEEKARRHDVLVPNGLKAMPPGSEIGSPNQNGLHENANGPIPVKKGLVRSPQEQIDLMVQFVNDGKIKPSAPSAQANEGEPKAEYRQTMYKPMPQNVGALDQENDTHAPPPISRKADAVLAQSGLNKMVSDTRRARFDQQVAAIDQQTQGSKSNGKEPVAPKRTLK
jgi:hypothetical protein